MNHLIAKNGGGLMMMGGEDEVQQETGRMRGRQSALQTREVNFGYAPTKVLAMFFYL